MKALTLATAVPLLAMSALAEDSVSDGAWYYRPYEYEAWKLRQMREEADSGILHFGYPGRFLRMVDQPVAVWSKKPIEGLEPIPGSPNIPPHLAPRRTEPVAVRQVDGLYDLGREDIGYVCAEARDCPVLFVGESRAEAENSDTNVFEQSTEMVKDGEGRWRSAIPLALRYFRFEKPVESVMFLSQVDRRDPVGRFTCSDARKETVWSLGVETLRLCTRTFLVDGIKRDRLPWAADLAVEVLAEAYSFGDPEPVKRTLSALGSGEPCEVGNINGIASFSMWWVIAHDLLQRYFHEPDYLKRHYPRICARMTEMSGHEDERGFFVRDLGWDFMDWTGRDGGQLKSDISRQIIYFGALMSASRLAERVGDADSANAWRSKAARLKSGILSVGMDDTRHSRILAIVLELVEEDDVCRYAHEIVANGLPPTVTPYMSTFEVMALMKGGRPADALKKFESVWGAMADAGVDAYWESWDGSEKGAERYVFYKRPFGRSLCHAWSSGPVFLIPGVFLGIEPAEDGWRRIRRRPYCAEFAPDAEVVIPTPNGPRTFKAGRALPVGQVGLEDGALKHLRELAKATFDTRVDPEEHIRGFASVGDQEKGVANARQEFCGHYLDLCATYWQLDRDDHARQFGDHVVDSLEVSMSKDGYIGGEVPERRMHGFSLWNQAHAVYGLLRFAETTGSAKAKTYGLRAADWLLHAHESMSPERLVDASQVGNGGSQNLTAFYALVMASRVSGERKYVDYVKRTLSGLEATKMNLISNADCLALQSRKGIEMINAWRGVLAYARFMNDGKAIRSCSRYWQSIADTQIRNTGAATNRERFLPDGNAPAILPVEMRPNENCVQCGWLRFTRELFSATGDVRCAQEMERTLYNHILGSVASDGSDFAYYQGNVGRKVFHKNGMYQCCRYRGFAIMAHLQELILDDDGINVTPLVYAPLAYQADDGFALKVSTEYPKTGHIELLATTRVPRKLKLPIPSWCRNWTLCINGEKITPTTEDGFAIMNLEPSGEVAVQLDFKMEFVRKSHDIDGKQYAEYAYGPLVLVRDTGLGDKLGEILSTGLRFARQDSGKDVFAKFSAVDSGGRTHTLVDYAHACRANPDMDEFEVFIPTR